MSARKLIAEAALDASQTAVAAISFDLAWNAIKDRYWSGWTALRVRDNLARAIVSLVDRYPNDAKALSNAALARIGEGTDRLAPVPLPPILPRAIASSRD